jgi:Holliday junction resolvasome RuvABC endonuclease subunit
MKNNNTVLALFPNARGMGYVLAEAADKLLYYGIARIRPMTSQAHINRFRKLLDEYKPEVVVIRDFKRWRNVSKRVIKVIKVLDKEAMNKGLKVHRYHRTQIKEVFEVFKARNKYEIATSIADLLPELKEYVPKTREYPEPEPYRIALFDCVSLLLTHFYLME